MNSASWQRNVFAASLASFIAFMSFTLVMPFLPLFFQELGVHDVGAVAMWSGFSFGITPALTAFLSPLWGRLADRLGFQFMLQRSLIAFMVLMAAMAFVTAPWHVFALRALQGLVAGYGVLTLTMAAQSAPKEHLARAIGQVQTGQRLGPAIGPLIGGIIAPLVGLRNAFLVSAGIYTLASVLVFSLYREPPRAPVATTSDATGVTFKNVLAFQNFVLLMGVLFGVQFVDRSLAPILPLYVAHLNVPSERVPLISGILFSLAAAAAAGGNQTTARLMRRVRARRLLAIGAFVGCATSAGIAAATNVSWLLVAVPLFGLAIGITLTAAYTSAGSVVPQGAHGVSFGVLTTASLVGFALSPVLSGLIAARSLRLVFTLDAAILAAVTAAVWRMMAEATGERGEGEGKRAVSGIRIEE